MDISEFERRAAALMGNIVVVGDDGVARPSPDLDPLIRDIARTINGAEDSDALQDLARALEMMKATLSDPETAGTLAGVQSKGFRPNPEICDAIEDCDVNAVRAALRDWDINRTFGDYESTALYHAMSCGTGASLDVISFLLDAGADPKKGLGDTNVLHGLGFAHLDDVAPQDLAAIVRRCVDLGADIEQRSNRLQWTPLITAVSEWNPVATEALLLAGADINVRAGAVDGVCYAGESCLAFASGNAKTTAVLKRHMSPN